jgi:hypothetical protein
MDNRRKRAVNFKGSNVSGDVWAALATFCHCIASR